MSLIYITRKSLEQQRSNTYSNSTNTRTPTLEHRYDCENKTYESGTTGSSCKSCVEPQRARARENACASCNEGFYLSDSQTCIPFLCEEGQEGTSQCKRCEDQIDRVSNNNDCAECFSGFYLENQRCFPFDCVTGTGDSCKYCVDQVVRTSDRDCSHCNDGFTLDSETKRCVPYECEPAKEEGDGCASCVSDQSLRTRHNACATCFPGYTLQEDQTCQAIDCITTSSGRGCATCVAQNLRLTNRDCGSCHSGYYLNNNRCYAFGCVIGRWCSSARVGLSLPPV